MTKKPDTASALAGILKARRGDDAPAAPRADAPAVEPPPTRAVEPPPPSPAPPAAPLPVAAPPPPTARPFRRGGKSSDKANYAQYSLYLRKDTRKKVGRLLDDLETGQDFSELVQELLEQWIKTHT